MSEQKARGPGNPPAGTCCEAIIYMAATDEGFFELKEA